MFEYNFGEISRLDDVLEHMKQLLEEYGNVTVADFYDLVGLTPNSEDTKRGWTKLENVKIEEYKYLIDNGLAR